MNDEERGKKKRRMSSLAGLLGDGSLSLLLRLLITVLIFFTNVTRAEEILLTVNVKKPLALTSDKFLSYTLDPTIVLTGDALTKNPERSINMAKALSPAYVRIGGPRSNSYTFERPHRLQNEEDPAYTITETNWIHINRWAENAGLDIVACIAPQHSESGGRDPGWDSRNALDLISFSDHMGFNTSWQLGYECQTRCDIAGSDIGRDVLRLRSMLNAFPRYSKSIVTGPDVVTYRTKFQQQYLQDYLNLAGNALSAITWHPDFSGITLDAYGVSMHHDTLAIDRDGLYRVVGRLIGKKPLWLAEAKPEACKKQFLGALVWTRRLGNAARLGAQVIMRQPSDSDLFQPTPDYWVSVIHKALVGREVLDAKITTGNRTHVHFYCQCTRPSSRYEKGSLTIFGINLTPAKIMINLKGLKIKNIHRYILLPGYDAENRMFSETVLLNNEPLNLIYNELPEMRPAISTNSKGVLKLPSGGIGFWVLPGLKIKTCGGLEDDNTDKMLLRKLTKRLGEPESAEYSIHEEDASEDKDYDIMSTEERRYSSKMNNRKRQRKYNYSEEDEAARGYKKFEAKMDLERLERLLRKRDSYDERKSRGRTGYFGFDEKTLEKLNDNEDEYIEEETGEEIRAKLEEYKKRLREYENRNKKVDLRSREKIIETTETETIDRDKVIEAMQLISKMENAMKSFEKSVDDADLNEALNQDGVNDVSEIDSSNKNINPEDAFLDELLKSEKIKRTSVPTKIEDQLRAIYQMLAEEKERRQRNIAETTATPEAEQNGVEPTKPTETNSSRTRRDIGDETFDDDPLGLRKGLLFDRRGRNDEMRGQNIGGIRNRRRDEDDQINPKSVSDSEDNNLYRFDQREPLKDFPEDDVFVEVADEEVKKTSMSYDRIKEDSDNDDDNDEIKKMTNTWIKDDDSKMRHLPMEFYENTKMAVSHVREDLKEHNEPWKAQLIDEKIGRRFNNVNNDEVATYEKIIQQQNPDVQEDRSVKESTVRKFIDYYDNPRAHREEIMDYGDKKRLENKKNGEKTLETRQNTNLRMDQDAYRRINSEVERKYVKDLTSGDNGIFTDFDPMHLSRTAADSTENKQEFDVYQAGYLQSPHKAPRRIKRSTGDLEDILDREMIFEDDNNLKDCECRVVRGTKARKTLTDLKPGESRRISRRTDRPDCRRKIEEMSERRKQRKREGPPTVKPSGRFPTTRARRQVKCENENEMEGLIKIEQKFTDDESPLTAESENEANEDAHYMSAEVELQAEDDKVEKVLGSEEVIEVTIDDEDENSGCSNLAKRHNDETTAASQDQQKTTIGLETVDEVQTEVTKSPVKREDNFGEKGLEGIGSPPQNTDNVSKKEPEAAKPPVIIVDNVGKEEAGAEKSPVKMADVHDGPEMTKSPVKIVDNVAANEEPEMTKSLVDGVDNLDKEKLEATESPVKREDNVGKEDMEMTNPPVKMVENIMNEEPEVTKSLVGRVVNVDEDEEKATKSPVKREDNVGKEDIEMTNPLVKMVENIMNEEPEVTKSLVGRVVNIDEDEEKATKSPVKREDGIDNKEPEITNSPVKLEEFVTNEESGATKSPVKRAYTAGKKEPEVTEFPVEPVKNAVSSTSKDPSKSSEVKLEGTKNRKDSFFRDRKNNKGNSRRNSKATKIDKTNTPATKLPETMESAKTDTSETDIRVAGPRSIEAEAKVDEPLRIKGESNVVKPRSIEPESKIDGALPTDAETKNVEPRSIKTESKIVEPFSIDTETKIDAIRSIETDSKIIEPDSIDAEIKIVEPRSIKVKSKIVEPRSSAVSTKTEESSISAPVELTEETSGKIGQDNGEDKRNATKIEGENEDGDDETKVKRGNVEEKLNSTNTESLTTTSDSGKVSKQSKLTAVDLKTPIKSPQKIKNTDKITDTAKAREARLSARSEALFALKKENDEKKTKKSRESTSRIMAIEHAINVQKKRAEQLEKLREKLRQKRAKVVKDSRDDFLDELEDKSSDVEERNLRRREIIDVLQKDEDISDIVDREKLDYLMRNKPINYEATSENSDVKEINEKGKKYTPETIEIVRPIHETRERRVYPRKRTIKATNDPTLIAYEVPDEINFETMKKNLQEDVICTNHRIERRDGKSYYSVVESLENPRIYHHQHDEQSGEEASIEMADSAQQNGEETDNYDDDSDEMDHHRDYQRRHRMLDSNDEETVQRLSNFDSSTRLVRNPPNNKYVCLRENSEESSGDNNDELFKLVKEKDHYMAMPVQDAKIDDKEKYTAKKKSMKTSDYELRQKYNSPKYARLAMNKTAISEGENIMRKNTEGNGRTNIQEKEETSQETVSKKMKKRTRSSNDEIRSWLVERTRGNSKRRNFPASDEIDLDEALNSSSYELLMLIPVNKNQKRIRQRRHVENEILRNEEESAVNAIPIEMTMKKDEIRKITKDENEDTSNNEVTQFKMDKNDDMTINEMTKFMMDQNNDMTINEISTTDNTKIDESGPFTLPEVVNEDENEINDDEKGKKGTTLDRYAIERIVPSAPNIVSNNPKKSIEDDGVPSLLEVALPRLEATVTNGLGKARRISESVEKFINDFDDDSEQIQLELEIESEKSSKSEENVENNSPISSNIFGSTFMNVKKFFDFLTGMVHIFQIN